MIKAFQFTFLTLFLSPFGMAATAEPTAPSKKHWVLTDPALLRSLGIPSFAQDKGLGVAIASLMESDLQKLSERAHELGRCGGYERLGEWSETPQSQNVEEVFSMLRRQDRLNQQARKALLKTRALEDEPVRQEFIEKAVAQVSAEELQKTVTWYSSFETRLNKDPQRGMVAVKALYEKLDALTAPVKDRVSVAFIRHESTPQHSIRVSFKGSQRPKEKVVVGAHLDSINWGEGAGAPAPGADDNASGTSNVFELVRILVGLPQPERTIDVYFYAGEESGLLGSKEIAVAHRKAQSDVIGALQLDMTLHPGSGEGSLTFVDDFTSVALTSYLKQLNDLYVHATIRSDTCGYGCSDHASWHRQGFAAVFPFESQHASMNRDIHTRQDVIHPTSSFVHSAYFSRLAVAFALDLAYSTRRPADPKKF